MPYLNFFSLILRFLDRLKLAGLAKSKRHMVPKSVKVKITRTLHAFKLCQGEILQ